MPPASILFTLPSLSPTSSKLPRVLAICKALDRQRFQPLVSVDHKGRLNSDGLRLLEEAGVPVYLMRMSPHKRSFVHSMIDMAGTPGTLRKSNIVIQHSSDYSRGWTEPLLSRLGGVRYWVATKTNLECKGVNWRLRLCLARQIVVQTSYVARELESIFPGIERRLVLIPNGVDTNVFKSRPRDNRLANKLALKHNELVLGCVAHFVPVKDHLSLLRALRLLRRSDINLLFIGADIDASYVRNVKHVVSELGLAERVHFLGHRADVNHLHSIMDGLILTSKAESLSNAVLEGMASGLPIVCSDVGGMRDAVLPGVNGWLVPRGEGFVERLAAAIDEWAADPQRRKVYGAASRRIVEERFSLDQMVQGHIQLYESLLEQDA